MLHVVIATKHWAPYSIQRDQPRHSWTCGAWQCYSRWCWWRTYSFNSSRPYIHWLRVPFQLSSHFILCDSLNPITLSQESSSQADPAATAHDIYTSLALKAKQRNVLQDHLTVGLRQIWGKQTQPIAQGVMKMPLTPTTTSFLKRSWSFLEFSLLRKRLSNAKWDPSSVLSYVLCCANKCSSHVLYCPTRPGGYTWSTAIIYVVIMSFTCSTIIFVVI